MTQPEVSVIVPVYNAGKFLEYTLNAVKKQTLTNIEIICVNDGSTDNSADILQAFSKRDKRFKIFSQPNQGGSAARNRGLEEASGKYIAFLDNDDIYHPRYLEILLANLQKTDSDISCCAYRKFYGAEDYSFTETYEKSNLCRQL